MDNVEMAQEHLEHAAHAGHDSHAIPPAARRAAILVAAFAAIAVVVEMSANDAQTAYLARTITASDLWAEYQAKSVRRTVRLEAADSIAAAAPAAATGAATGARAAIDRAQSEATRLAADMTQLAARAHADEQARDEALHHHEQLERSVRVLQIAIVLIGLYLATRLELLVVIGAVLGVGAILWGALAAATVI